LPPILQGIEVLEPQSLGLEDLGERMIMVVLLEWVDSAQVGECLLLVRLVAVVPEVEVLFDSNCVQDPTEGLGVYNGGMHLVAAEQDHRTIYHHSRSELTSSGSDDIGC
jgi:hypothetical protein